MNGIIIVDKPAGLTSFDVVSRLRRLTGERKIGHAGTLDPMATGVLPVFLGTATKAIDLLPSQLKGYTAAFRLGLTTDTGDITGRILSVCEVKAGFPEVEKAAFSLEGESLQLPPMYSAIKQNGVRLYSLAREGITVERKPRPIHVFHIALSPGNPDEHEYNIEILCSKGTYIRTIITDIGEKLGCGATMTSLRRTSSAGFDLNMAFTLEAITELAAAGRLGECMIAAETPFGEEFEVNVTPKQAVRFLNGGELSYERLAKAPRGVLCRVKCGDRFLGLAENDCENRALKVKCLFARSLTE